MDKLTKEQRRKNMQAVKSKGSKIEQLLGSSMWKNGLRYRKNDKTIFGKPDFSFKKHKVVVFCDSEFWHGKDWENKKDNIKTNVEFWQKKIERNIERDNEVNTKLTQEGWIVIRFWGKDILSNVEKCVKQVNCAINDRY